MGAKSALACVAWSVIKADADPPAPTGVLLDSTRLALSRMADSVTLLVEVPGSTLRRVIASGACTSPGATCLAALAGGPGIRGSFAPRWCG